MFAYGETVTVHSPGVVADPYSTEPTFAWELEDGQEWLTEPEDTDVDGVGVEPRPSSEPVEDARNAVVSGFTLYFAAGADVTTPQSRVTVRGGLYEVLGDSAGWRSPLTGWNPGIVVQVGRVAG